MKESLLVLFVYSTTLGLFLLGCNSTEGPDSPPVEPSEVKKISPETHLAAEKSLKDAALATPSNAAAHAKAVQPEHSAAMIREKSNSVGKRALKVYLEGDHAAGEKMSEEAVKVDPTSALAHYRLAGIYRWQDKFAEAEASYRRAIETADKPNAVYWKSLGEVQLRQAWILGSESEQGTAKSKAALESFIEARNINPELPGLDLTIGGLFVDFKQYDAAILAFQQEIKNNGETRAFFRLARVYAETGKADLALKTAKQGVERSPKKYSVWSELGYFHLSQHQPKEAVAAFKRCQELYTGDDHYGDHGLGLAYAELGEKVAAKKHLNRLLKTRSSSLSKKMKKDVEDALARLERED